MRSSEDDVGGRGRPTVWPTRRAFARTAVDDRAAVADRSQMVRPRLTAGRIRPTLCPMTVR